MIVNKRCNSQKRKQVYSKRQTNYFEYVVDDVARSGQMV